MKTMRNQAKHILRAGLAVILVLSMLVSASVMCFAEETDTSTETVVKVGIKDKSVSLGENIIVKFHTDSTTGDGSKLSVSFNGETFEITENKDGVFEFIGVTPQKLGDEMTATLYGADGAQIGDAATLSVKSYLDELLALTPECGMPKLKYQAMRELCVNMLNYGAAAQTYVDYKTDNLVNKDLSDELKALATEKITVTDTDKAVNGDAWVGAGVRFDYKLGLYYVFKAASADEYTATINGTEVTPEAYTALGEGYYVIRYNSFNATNMNDVVTAKLTKGTEEQSFTYSIKSYVASKGGDDSAIANLVNATYTYGYAAVAYSAEYVTTDPTFEKEGSISMDAKGYDFSNTKYGTVTLPKLDFTAYTAETVNSGTELAPVVTTTFTLNDDTVAYAKVFNTDNCISLEGKLYSQYDLANFKFDDVTVSYDTSDKSYTYDVADGKTVHPTKPFTAFGADLTITGVLNFENTAGWEHYGINVTVGTAQKAANITIGGSDYTPLYVYTDAKFLVSEGSTVKVTKCATYSIYIGGGDTTSRAALIVDGTLTASGGRLRASHYTKFDDTLEYGFDPQVYVRRGTLTVPGLQLYSLQVGSEAENASGTLIITGHGGSSNGIKLQKDSQTTRLVFAKGTVDFVGLSNGIWNNDKNDSHIDVRGGMEFIATDCTLGHVFQVASNNDNGNHRTYIQKGVKYYSVTSGEKTDITDTNTKFLYHSRNTSNLYSWDFATVKMMENGVEVTKTGRVLNHEVVAKGTYQSAAACSAAPEIAEGTLLTATETTQDMGTLGTFVQGTYGDNQHVWYQIVD